MRIDGAAADWRRPGPYSPLIRCDRALFAWEWLRRDPAYRSAAAADWNDAGRFGLLRFEPPAHSVPHARPFWSADMDPAVLASITNSVTAGDALQLDRLVPLATIHRDEAGEHVLISDGYQALRLDVAGSTVSEGPICLDWRLAGLETLRPQLDALHRLVHCHRWGRFGVPTRPTRARARRLALLLRVRDALLDSATTREIADALYGAEVAGARWRVGSDAWRARVQRLAAGARRLAALGPAAILRSP